MVSKNTPNVNSQIVSETNKPTPKLTPEEVEEMLDQTFQSGRDAVAELERQDHVNEFSKTNQTGKEVLAELNGQQAKSSFEATPEAVEGLVDQTFIPKDDAEALAWDDNFIKFRLDLRAGKPWGSLDGKFPRWRDIAQEMLNFYVTGHDIDAAEEVYQSYQERNKDFAKSMAEAARRAAANAPTFVPQSLTDLINRPPKTWLVKDVFGPGDIGMIFGPPAAKKSFAVIDGAISFCTGGLFANRFEVTRPLNVAYCASEGLSGLPSRFRAAANHHRVSSLPNFHFFDTVPMLFSDTAAEANISGMAKFIGDWQYRQEQGEVQPLDLLIIDTLHGAAVGAEENSSKDMGKVLEAIKMASTRLRCAVMLVHHTNKAGTAERGSSALRGAMDFMLKVTPKAGKTDYSTLECEKLKDGEQWKPQDFCLMQDGDSAYVWWAEPKSEESDAIGKEWDLTLRITDVMRKHEVPLPVSKIAEATGEGRTYVNRILTDMMEDGRAERELMYPGRKAAPSNPFVYFLSPQDDEV